MSHFNFDFNSKGLVSWRLSGDIDVLGFGRIKKWDLYLVFFEFCDAALLFKLVSKTHELPTTKDSCHCQFWNLYRGENYFVATFEVNDIPISGWNEWYICTHASQFLMHKKIIDQSHVKLNFGIVFKLLGPGCDSHTYSVFTKMSHYLPWIQSHFRSWHSFYFYCNFLWLINFNKL